jgi:hypothetical protein
MLKDLKLREEVIVEADKSRSVRCDAHYGKIPDDSRRNWYIGMDE